MGEALVELLLQPLNPEAAARHHQKVIETKVIQPYQLTQPVVPAFSVYIFTHLAIGSLWVFEQVLERLHCTDLKVSQIPGKGWGIQTDKVHFTFYSFNTNSFRYKLDMKQNNSFIFRQHCALRATLLWELSLLANKEADICLDPLVWVDLGKFSHEFSLCRNYNRVIQSLLSNHYFASNMQRARKGPFVAVAVSNSLDPWNCKLPGCYARVFF